MPTPASSLGAAPAFLEQLARLRRRPGPARFRAVGDVERAAAFGQDGAAEVGHGEGRVGGAEVGGDHDPGTRVEREPGRRAAAGEGASPAAPRGPASSSASTRAATVDRASTGDAGQLGPGAGPPSRSSWSTTPGPTTGLCRMLSVSMNTFGQ